MGRIGLAFKVFFGALFNADTADKIDKALAAPAEAPPQPEPKKVEPPKPKPPARSEAITLLAALRCEARLVDFLQEKIDAYSDDQIGAAVRDIHRDAAAVLERMFGLKPLMEQEEGSAIEIPAGFDAARFRLTGNVAGEPPYQGSLVHHGWEATRCELPEWTGAESSAKVVAPAEAEL